jgi:hypothetical protein
MGNLLDARLPLLLEMADADRDQSEGTPTKRGPEPALKALALAVDGQRAEVPAKSSGLIGFVPSRSRATWIEVALDGQSGA